MDSSLYLDQRQELSRSILGWGATSNQVTGKSVPWFLWNPANKQTNKLELEHITSQRPNSPL